MRNNIEMMKKFDSIYIYDYMLRMKCQSVTCHKKQLKKVRRIEPSKHEDGTQKSPSISYDPLYQTCHTGLKFFLSLNIMTRATHRFGFDLPALDVWNF
jgi:hypothetical protein